MFKKQYFVILFIFYTIVIGFSYYYCQPNSYEIFQVLFHSIFISMLVASLTLLCLLFVFMGLGKRLMEWTSDLIRFVPYISVFCLGILFIGTFVIMLGDKNFASVVWLLPTIISYYASGMISYELQESVNEKDEVVSGKKNNQLLKKAAKYIYMYLNIFIVFIFLCIYRLHLISFGFDKEYMQFLSMIYLCALFVSLGFIAGAYILLNKILLKKV